MQWSGPEVWHGEGSGPHSHPRAATDVLRAGPRAASGPACSGGVGFVAAPGLRGRVGLGLAPRRPLAAGLRVSGASWITQAGGLPPGQRGSAVRLVFRTRLHFALAGVCSLASLGPSPASFSRRAGCGRCLDRSPEDMEALKGCTLSLGARRSGLRLAACRLAAQVMERRCAHLLFCLDLALLPSSLRPFASAGGGAVQASQRFRGCR